MLEVLMQEKLLTDKYKVSDKEVETYQFQYETEEEFKTALTINGYSDIEVLIKNFN
ncbi:hypothetical protein HPK19_25615 (plasmid) [Arthrobacter citreus]|nr:hypothetical protein HPK19_25615 [Arthrobacter citreus]